MSMTLTIRILLQASISISSPASIGVHGSSAGKSSTTYLHRSRLTRSNRRKVLKNIHCFYQHLRSNVHTNERLRCPACLRQYDSCTALVQHAESQAKICDIRDSAEYRAAVEQITGGFVNTMGKHADDTVRYTAPKVSTTAKDINKKATIAHEDYWARREEERLAAIEYRGKTEEW